jgi:hypothetical protein
MRGQFRLTIRKIHFCGIYKALIGKKTDLRKEREREGI